MKIAKKKATIQTTLVNLIFNLERSLAKLIIKSKYIAIECHNYPGSYEINLSYYGGGTNS